MSLLDIKKHMMAVKLSTLGNLCRVFKAEPETMRGLLSHWMRKGNLICCKKYSACGSKCFKCPETSVEIYEWVDITHPAI